MNLIKFFLIITIINGGCKAQNNQETKAIAMLKEFYSAHSKIWATTRSVSPDKVDRQLDSIQKKYCIPLINQKAKKYLEEGHDLFTKDFGIDAESLKNMEIEKDVTNGDFYKIIYDVKNADASGNPVLQHVVLTVGVVSDGEIYKIESVK